MKKVLVTGANGYIAKHIIADLYKNKFSVIGTLRNIQKAKTVQSDIENHLGHKIDIAFKEVCLDSDEGYSLVNDKSLIDDWWDLNKDLYEDPSPYEDYEPTDHEMMSSFGTKWHDKL